MNILLHWALIFACTSIVCFVGSSVLDRYWCPIFEPEWPFTVLAFGSVMPGLLASMCLVAFVVRATDFWLLPITVVSGLMLGFFYLVEDDDEYLAALSGANAMLGGSIIAAIGATIPPPPFL